MPRLPRGAHVPLLHKGKAKMKEIHGLGPVESHVAATQGKARMKRDPRAAPVESHVRCYTGQSQDERDATGLPVESHVIATASSTRAR